MTHDHARRMTDVKMVKEFALAGKARLTLVSVMSGTRFTFKIKAKIDHGQEKPALWFVSVLTGSDNESSYSYLGIIRDGGFMRTAKSKIGDQAASHLAWRWFWAKLNEGKISDQLEVWHEGSCGRCGRALTVPESIARGIGPECIKYVGA